MRGLTGTIREAPWTEDADDPLVYFTWCRQWICLTFGSWDGELEFSAAMIAQDVRNNSAWNHRWFALTHGGGVSLDADNSRASTEALGEIISREVDFALKTIRTVTRNESSWSYLRGILRGRPLASCKRVLQVRLVFLLRRFGMYF